MSFCPCTRLKVAQRKQNTLAQEVSFSGIGIHTGKVVTMRFCPAKEGSGIAFKRVDLPSAPIIPATLEYVKDTARSTTIGMANIMIHTVEHVLAALKAYKVDNLLIELNNIEPPVGNGSSDIFVEMIEEVGLHEQQAFLPIVKIEKPIFYTKDDIHIVALPANEFKISYTLSYPHVNRLKAQYHSVILNESSFKREIAPCRTFSLYEEVSMLMDRGLIKGGSLDNAVVIKDDSVLSKNGLFFSDEMVRHKILDMIGDLSLIGFEFLAHIISVRSGHASNYAFANTLYHYITSESHDGK
ncbi:MAG: UDP-3-O-acyl-N-acetylglucosamine deacetylase [Parachlamydiaceae bacterium]